MFSLETTTEFLGWCLIINTGIMLLTLIGITSMKDVVAKIHAKMFAMEQSELSALYFKYLAQYKLLVLTFNLTPYLALKIMA